MFTCPSDLANVVQLTQTFESKNIDWNLGKKKFCFPHNRHFQHWCWKCLNMEFESLSVQGLRIAIETLPFTLWYSKPHKMHCRPFLSNFRTHIVEHFASKMGSKTLWEGPMNSKIWYTYHVALFDMNRNLMPKLQHCLWGPGPVFYYQELHNVVNFD